MSNSTQNDEIGKMERAINEGFAESERDLMDKKTPLDQPTQNDWEVRFNDRFLNNWGTLLDIKHFIRKELADARREVLTEIESGLSKLVLKYPELKTAIKSVLYDRIATLREEEGK